MVYPANKSTYPIRVTDDDIPATDYNGHSEGINEIQEALGYSTTFMMINSFINPSVTDTHNLGSTLLKWLKLFVKEIAVANLEISLDGDDSVINGGDSATNEIQFRMLSQNRGGVNRFGWNFRDDNGATILDLQRGAIRIGNNSAGITFVGDITSDMQIDSKLAVGSSTPPVATLDLTGTFGMKNNSSFSMNDTGGNGRQILNYAWNDKFLLCNGVQGDVYFSPVGNIAIGVALPSEKLHIGGNIKVEGTGEFHGDILPEADDTYNLGSSTKAYKFIYSKSTIFANAYNSISTQLQIQVNGQHAIWITFQRNIGMGIDDPVERLEVDGNVRLRGADKGMILTTPDGTKEYKISVDNSGNIISTLVV